jgi:hypothetical protein
MKSTTYSKGEELPTYTKNKTRIGYNLHINCLLKHVIEGNIEGRIVTRRRGKRRKQILDDLKETIVQWKLKEEALDGALWRTRLGRRYGPASRQTTQRMCRVLFIPGKEIKPIYFV